MPNLTNRIVEATERAYYAALEEFAHAVGATPENAHEYSLVYQPSAEWPEIWHNGTKVSEVHCYRSRNRHSRAWTITFEVKHNKGTGD